VKPFVVNRHGRLVFPANFLGELDFSVLESLDQFTAVIGRDFEAKAPTGTGSPASRTGLAGRRSPMPAGTRRSWACRAESHSRSTRAGKPKFAQGCRNCPKQRGCAFARSTEYPTMMQGS
jgi:hypothetical protein